MSNISPERWLTKRQHRQCLVACGGIYHHIVDTKKERKKKKKKSTNRLLLLSLLALDSASLLLALALLEEGLGNEDLVLSGNGAVTVSKAVHKSWKKFRRV